MLIRRIGWGYVLLIALWLLLRLLLFDRLWWLALINSLAFYLFVPLVFILPAALWQRQSRLLLGLALPLLAFIALFGALFVPPAARPRPQAQGPTLTAMSFNLLWSNRNYDDIVQAIQTAAPDIIGFEEATPKTIAALLARLASAYPYHTFTADSPSRSVGVLSRWPLTSISRPLLPSLLFSSKTPHASATAWSGSARRGNPRWYLRSNADWASGRSGEIPRRLEPGTAGSLDRRRTHV